MFQHASHLSCFHMRLYSEDRHRDKANAISEWGYILTELYSHKLKRAQTTGISRLADLRVRWNSGMARLLWRRGYTRARGRSALRFMGLSRFRKPIVQIYNKGGD